MPVFRGEDELMAQIHDASMSRETGEACFGRCAKAVMPAFLEWLQSEIDRQNATGEAVAPQASHAAVELSALMSASVLINLFGPNGRLTREDLEPIIEVTTEQFSKSFIHFLDTAYAALGPRDADA